MAHRYRRHTLEVYGVQLWHATTRAQWAALARIELDGDTSVPDSLGHTTLGTRDYRTEVAIYTSTEDLDERGAMACCVHEAVHAAGSILDHLGQRDAGDRGSEAMAYLVEWIAAWLWDGVARHYPKGT